MTLNTECPPCQMGDHKNHYEVVQSVPRGMMGGSRCICKGECKKHGPPSIDKLLGLPEGTMGRLIRR